MKLAFIAHDASRKATYNKRKNGILKKVSELSILCGVPACAIIYGDNMSKPDLWPPSPISVRRVVSKFLEMPMMEQGKKMVNQEAFLQQRVSKAEEQLKKHKKDNREMEMTCVMLRGIEGLLAPSWLQALTVLDLTDLEWVIDQTLKQVNQMQEKLSRASSEERTKDVPDESATQVVASTLKESMHKREYFADLMDPFKQVVQPLEDDINPSNIMWSNPFLP